MTKRCAQPPLAKRTSPSKPARKAPCQCDDGVRTIQNIYRQFKKVSGGAEGGVVGFNGSIRPKCLARLLRALNVNGNELVDFGAGSGRVLFSAVAEGAYRSHGYELPENKGMKYVFDAMLIASATLTQDRVEWIGKDILDLKVLKGSPSCAYSFWVGFPLSVYCGFARKHHQCRPSLFSKMPNGSMLIEVCLVPLLFRPRASLFHAEKA